MTKLFKNKIIKQKLVTFRIDDFEEKLDVVKKWHTDYHTGTLKTDKEISRAPGWTQEFLGEILGYSPKPSEDFTYEVEPSIAGQRPDFILGYFSSNKGYVIGELKGAQISLDTPQKGHGSITPVQQAFKYKGNVRDSSFVIVSNFFETRLYYDNYLDYEMWTLDTLVNPKDDYFQLRKFLYLLSEQNLITKRGESTTKGLISYIQNQQKEITKGFYKQYSLLRKELFKDIIVQAKKSGKAFQKSELDIILSKTQKIIDRIIFIHFCEDLDLLPQGKLAETVSYAENMPGMKIWGILKGFFEAVNSGSEKLNIPDGYNGGLFHKDEQLEALEIGDEICKKFVDLGEYDFEDDLSVNILGHIFEQSISDIEELKDKIQKNEEVVLSKRKKDGVFYTPEYIVDYIVKNSVGKKIESWEEELRKKHNLLDTRLGEKNYQKKAISVYTELQEKLQNITVLDPACGSGAFLVKVFDFLLAKNEEIANTLLDLKGGAKQMGFEQTQSHFKSILQNNIYGVDLNEESVEITKLSLWLRTASKGKKLANLDKNIKCGNSLIDDPAIAGEKAFSWQSEYPQIFEDGGFDVIVGNPPYGAQIEKASNYIAESYLLFYELGVNLLSKGGLLSFITPDSWLTNNNAIFLRELFINSGVIYDIYDVYKVFTDAPDVWCNIVSFRKDFSLNKTIIHRDAPYDSLIFQFEIDWIRIKSYYGDKWFIYINNNLNEIFNKINNNDILDNHYLIKRGFSPTPNTLNITTLKTERQIIGGEDFGRYNYKIKPKYLIDDYSKSKKQIQYVKEQDFIGIQRIRTNSLDFKSRWLVCQFFDKGTYTPIDSIGFIMSKSSLELKYLFVLLNSFLFNIYYKLHYTDKNVKPIYLKELPIKNITPSEQTPFIEKADFMLEHNKLMGEKVQKFLKRVQGNFELEKLSKKLQAFYELTFEEFVKELKKVKVELSLKDQDEWQEHFDNYKEEVAELKTKIDVCDREIDEMVFDLYGLNEEERKIVMES